VAHPQLRPGRYTYFSFKVLDTRWSYSRCLPLKTLRVNFLPNQTRMYVADDWAHNLSACYYKTHAKNEWIQNIHVCMLYGDGRKSNQQWEARGINSGPYYFGGRVCAELKIYSCTKTNTVRLAAVFKTSSFPCTACLHKYSYGVFIMISSSAAQPRIQQQHNCDSSKAIEYSRVFTYA